MDVLEEYVRCLSSELEEPFISNSEKMELLEKLAIVDRDEVDKHVTEATMSLVFIPFIPFENPNEDVNTEWDYVMDIGKNQNLSFVTRMKVAVNFFNLKSYKCARECFLSLIETEYKKELDGEDKILFYTLATDVCAYLLHKPSTADDDSNTEWVVVDNELQNKIFERMCEIVSVEGCKSYYVYKNILSFVTSPYSPYYNFHSFVTAVPEEMDIELFRVFATRTPSVKYRTYALQYVMANTKSDDTRRIVGENMLSQYTLAPQKYKPIIMDVLMRYGNDNIKKEAYIILDKIRDKSFTIYENSENVHDDYFQEQININIVQLYELAKDNKPSWKTTSSIITSKALKYDVPEKSISKVLKNMECDVGTFTKLELKLTDILSLVVSYINLVTKTTIKEEMEKVLLVEIQSMSKTCFSGYAARLINVLCGFPSVRGNKPFEIKIKEEDQLVSRLNMRVKSMFNEIGKKNKEEGNILIGCIGLQPDQYHLYQDDIDFYNKCVKDAGKIAFKEMRSDFNMDDETYRLVFDIAMKRWELKGSSTMV